MTVGLPTSLNVRSARYNLSSVPRLFITYMYIIV